MGAIVTYPDTENRWFDTKKITLDKILQELNSAAVVSAGGLSGAGAPGAGLGANGDLYVDTTNRDLYAKIGGTWELWLDMV